MNCLKFFAKDGFLLVVEQQKVATPMYGTRVTEAPRGSATYVQSAYLGERFYFRTINKENMDLPRRIMS